MNKATALAAGKETETGLRVASIIRTAKLATFDTATAQGIGRISKHLLTEVRTRIAPQQGLSP